MSSSSQNTMSTYDQETNSCIVLWLFISGVSELRNWNQKTLFGSLVDMFFNSFTAGNILLCSWRIELLHRSLSRRYRENMFSRYPSDFKLLENLEDIFVSHEQIIVLETRDFHDKVHTIRGAREGCQEPPPLSLSLAPLVLHTIYCSSLLLPVAKKHFFKIFH